MSEYFYRNMPECPLACQGDEWHPLNTPPRVGGVRGGGKRDNLLTPTSVLPHQGRRKNKDAPRLAAGSFTRLRESIPPDVGDGVFCLAVIVIKTHAGENIVDVIEVFRQYPLTFGP